MSLKSVLAIRTRISTQLNLLANPVLIKKLFHNKLKHVLKVPSVIAESMTQTMYVQYVNKATISVMVYVWRISKSLIA